MSKIFSVVHVVFYYLLIYLFFNIPRVCRVRIFGTFSAFTGMDRQSLNKIVRLSTIFYIFHRFLRFYTEIFIIFFGTVKGTVSPD
jgi:hypothetical protein